MLQSVEAGHLTAPPASEAVCNTRSKPPRMYVVEWMTIRGGEGLPPRPGPRFLRVKNDIYLTKNRWGPFLVHTLLGSGPPPFPPPLPLFYRGRGEFRAAKIWNGKFWHNKSVTNYATIFEGPKPFFQVSFLVLVTCAVPLCPTASRECQQPTKAQRK